MDRIRTFLGDSVKRHHARVVAFAALGLSVGVLCMSLFLFLSTPTYEYEEVEMHEGVPISNDDVESIEEREVPTELHIPKINLTATFEGSLGLNDDGTIEVPDSYEEVGWYQYGPVPGDVGPAVILGHVDSYEGPAVFYSLGQLDVGDEVTVERYDGSEVVFEITELRRVEQSGFPSEDVYGDIDYAGLRLITCSGTFDRGAQRYSHNLIVFARLKEG